MRSIFRMLSDDMPPNEREGALHYDTREALDDSIYMRMGSGRDLVRYL
ncbi:MAG: hypothetical protein HFG58_06490 [Lachnospiraceae bacterium]|jgi:hypothetical protein|nr:hypothetical protein [Lachnospiraceae bacterium]